MGDLKWASGALLLLLSFSDCNSASSQPSEGLGAMGVQGDRGEKGDKGDPGAAGSGAYSEELGSFAGFTSTAYTGAFSGGRASVHTACAQAFAGSHFCHATEYIQANSAATIPAAGAWVDPSTLDGLGAMNSGMPNSGRYIYGPNCSSWSDGTDGMYGPAINSTGSIDIYKECADSRPLACCNTPIKTRFAGFTSRATSGAGGGRAKMHALCAAEFSGSHLCHAAEYIRADSPTPVPSEGAWIDPSTSDGKTTTNSGIPSSGRLIYGPSCNSWSDGTATGYGYWITPSGNISNDVNCTAARKLACCM